MSNLGYSERVACRIFHRFHGTSFRCRRPGPSGTADGSGGQRARHHRHPTREGKVSCCVVLDAFSRRVVGWSVDQRCETALVNDALSMASESRTTDEVSVHPFGPWPVQYTSWGFSNLSASTASRAQWAPLATVRTTPPWSLLGLDADRAAQPQEVAAQDRAVGSPRPSGSSPSTTPSTCTARWATSLRRIRRPTRSNGSIHPDLTLTTAARKMDVGHCADIHPLPSTHGDACRRVTRFPTTSGDRSFGPPSSEGQNRQELRERE